MFLERKFSNECKSFRAAVFFSKLKTLRFLISSFLTTIIGSNSEENACPNLFITLRLRTEEKLKEFLFALKRLQNYTFLSDEDWLASRVKLPEAISAGQSYFRDLRFFRADSEDMKSISPDQLCFRADQFWFSQSALFRTDNFSASSERNSSETALILGSENFGFQRCWEIFW